MATAWVLMYHNIALETRSIWYVSPDQLRDHLLFLMGRGYSIGDLHSIHDGCDNTVVISFDDAYANVYENAFPILSSYGITATVFVPVNFVGGKNTYDGIFDVGSYHPERIMTWSQLSDLQAAGWSIQSHGCSHIPLNRLTWEHIEDEILRSKRTIEDRLGSRVFAYAYAYGILPVADQLTSLEGLFETSGYEIAVLAYGGATQTPAPAPYRVNRVIVTSANSQPQLISATA